MIIKSKRIIISVCLLFFTLIAIINVSCGQTKTDKLDKLIGTYAADERFNGSVLVAEKGAVIYKKGFGLANMEWNIPNTPDTKHRLGSITKQFTSMLIMQLVQQGKLKLDVPISTYLPNYPKQNGDIITIHHLLTHSSGIPDFTSFPGFFNNRSRDPYTPAEIVSLFSDSALQFKPGARFEYCNSGYILLGVILEKVTSKTYEQLLHDNILTPLGMNHTGYDHGGTVLQSRASGYVRNGRSYVNAPIQDMSIPYAAGAMYSTVEDMYLWDQALYTEKLLQKKYLDLLFNKYVSLDEEEYYGYGWFIGGMSIGNSNEEIQTISHSGSINGFNSQFTRIPSDKSTIVLLNNTGEAPLEDMTNAILGILYDKPYSFPKKSIAFELFDVMEKEGIENANSFYEKAKKSGEYDLNEYEMNLVGYQFLQSNKAREAAAIFKLNVEAFPKSFNVYDSYGEALLALGNKNEAIENYKKSMQLNPGNTNGAKILKDLGVSTDGFIQNVPMEHLKLLEGEYIKENQSPEWKIIFEEVNGELTGNDKGYRYKLVPVGDDKFVNPDDGTSLEFDTRDKNAITLVLFGSKFKKVK